MTVLSIGMENSREAAILALIEMEEAGDGEKGCEGNRGALIWCIEP